MCVCVCVCDSFSLPAFFAFVCVIIPRHNEEGIPPYLRPSGQCEHSRYLLEMMEICFKQFLNIVSAHAHLLELLQTAKQGYAGECGHA